MNIDVILWVLGVAVLVLMAAFGFIVSWSRGQDERTGRVEKEVAAMRSHVAENYVRGHEILEVKKAVSDLRTEVMTVVSEMRTDITHQVNELTKAVYQMMGQNNSK